MRLIAFGRVPAFLAVLLLIPQAAYAYSRNLLITSDPSGATVTVLGGEKPFSGKTPATVEKFDLKNNVRYTVRVTMPDYEAEERTFDIVEAKTVKDKEWKFTFQLQPLKKAFPVTVVVTNVADPVVTVGSTRLDKAPFEAEVSLRRENKGSPWSDMTVQVERSPRYSPVSVTIPGRDVEAGAGSAGRFELRLGLPEVQRSIAVEVKANVQGADVSTNGVRVGAAPMTVNLLFGRSTPTDPWPPQVLRVEKVGYEYNAPGTEDPLPAFEVTLAADMAPASYNADQFREVRFVASPVRFFDVRQEGTSILETNVLSEVLSGDPKRPNPVVTVDTNRPPLVLSRMSVVPKQDRDVFVYSAAVWESRPTASGGKENVLVGANLQMFTAAGGTTPLTRGNFFDLDPFVTPDYVFFSSDRQKGRRIIYRIQNPITKSGRAGTAPITGLHTFFDTEPAVSPDGTKVAYVSRPLDAPPTTPSHIWITDADGKAPAERWEGRSPAWSPDGNRIAYVSTEGRLRVIDEGAVNYTELNHQAPQVASPVWLDDKQLVFASNKNENDRKRKNFDIWLINIETDTERSLTLDGSLDFWPAVNPENAKVFFFSNRGATRFGQDNLQIFSLVIE